MHLGRCHGEMVISEPNREAFEPVSGRSTPMGLCGAKEVVGLEA